MSKKPLTRISHQPSVADADPLAVAGRAPARRFDVVTATPAPSLGPCDPLQRRLEALTTNAGEKCGLRCTAVLEELSPAVGAFAGDMRAARQWDRTLVMTVPESGGRVAENGNLGTDRGSASAMLLAGGSVVPGLHGGVPDLDDGDVRHEVDVRTVHASVRRQWFGVDPAPILFGRFEPVMLLRV